MPNNFKLTGDYYVSKAGNDANDGLTPETPKLTVQAGLNLMTTSGKTLVIGSGVYKEDIVQNQGANFIYTIKGDGRVILEGNNTKYINHNFSQASSISIFDIEFRNSIEVAFYLNFNYGASFRLTNCVFYNCNFALRYLSVGGGANADWVNCYMINCRFINSNFISDTNVTMAGVSLIDKCIFINSLVNPITPLFTRFLNSYLDSYSLFKAPSSITAALFNFNNIQGKIIMSTNGAVSGVNSNGVALSFAQHRIDYPTYNVNSFSSDPKFNNLRLLDFTLQAGSPNVSASSDYVTNIGGTEYAVSYTASSAAFTTNATSQSLQYLGNLYYAISGSATTGSITSGPMFLQWPRTKPLTSVNWIGALEFNKTITASLAGNNNVPAYTTFTSASGLAGANPDRLKIRLRYSTQQTQPSTDAEWDNGGYWTAGTYQLFEPNTKPKVDYKGTGNGDPTYVETSAIGDLVPSWIQTEIILRNDYNR